MTFLEICVDSFASAVAAQAGGADRVELCAALSEGGLTPSAGMIRAVRKALTIGVQVMIRPRGGDFVYSDDEVAIMREDIAVAKACGGDGIVLGLLTPEQTIDSARTRALVELARPMQVTFHRAIDLTPDPVMALEAVIATGVDRVLSSGGSATAILGASSLRAMVERAAGAIEIMVGGGVRPENLRAIQEATGASSFHSGMSRRHEDSSGTARGEISFGLPQQVVHAEDVRALRRALEAT